MNEDLLRYWPLDAGVRYLNHGAFGACPWPVMRAQDEWRTRLERQPTQFMGSQLDGLLAEARGRLGAFMRAQPDDLAFVPNATTGVNTVLASLEFEPTDEILTTDHEYNACRNAIVAAARRTGAAAVVAHIPLPLSGPAEVIEAILDRVTQRTRLAVISHVTSPTGLVFPIEQLVALLAERGVDTLVDGAHAPGMVDVDISALGAAFYTGNCHKWMCAPKSSGFLHVRRDRQALVRPLITSHGVNAPRGERPLFRLEFDWTGTSDPTPYLSVSAALDFMATIVPGGWDEVRQRNHDLAVAGRQSLLGALPEFGPLAPAEMIGATAALELPPELQPVPAGRSPDARDHETYPLDPLHDSLLAVHGIEVPVFPWPHTPADGTPVRRLLRVSAQLYNSADDYEVLAGALRAT